jgi:hypothetical protein
MPTKKTYTPTQIKDAWKLFESRMVYRALIKGKWRLFLTFKDAKAEEPLKIEVKKAKDAMDFPMFLEAVVDAH